MKKFLAGLLCFVMILCMMPAVEVNAEEIEHNHAVCGSVSCAKDHNNDGVAESHANVVWQAWDGSDMDANTEGIQLTAGNWYLAENMNPTETIDIVGEVNLCLNGMVINSTAKTIMNVQEGAILNLCDCQSTEHKFTPNGDGKWILDEASGSKTVNGGVLTADAYMQFGAINSEGVLNMYGGNIVGNHTWHGLYGAITAKEGILNMYGGNVCGNTGSSAIFIRHWGVKSNIYGGKIYENTIENGAVHLELSSILGISGNVEIYNNTTGTETRDLVVDWTSVVRMEGELNNTNPIDISGSDDGVVIEADGTNVTDLTEYFDNFVYNDSTKVLFLSIDKKAIEINDRGIIQEPSKDNNYTVTVNDIEGVKYQWYVATEDINNPLGESLDGQTSAALNTSTLDNGKYICKVTWDKGTEDTSDDMVVLSWPVKYEKTVENPPAEQPPVENPPTENPPAEQPPVENPPAENPPAEQPPVENPPADNPTVNNPSGEGSAPEQQPTYSILEGADSDWTQGSEKEVTVRADGDFAKFSGVKVNDTVIDAKYYTAVSGSTIVTLKQEYLDTLTEGTYKMTIVYTDGECSTNFQIKKAVEDNPVENKPESGENKEDTQQNTTTTPPAAKEEVDSPKTGDNATFYVAMLFLVGSVVIGTSVVRRKQTR